jgi:hypothetical protein
VEQAIEKLKTLGYGKNRVNKGRAK